MLPLLYPQGMIPTKKSQPKSTEQNQKPNSDDQVLADDTSDEDLENFHDRYVKLRDALAS